MDPMENQGRLSVCNILTDFLPQFPATTIPGAEGAEPG